MAQGRVVLLFCARAGYMVVSFMVRQGMSVQRALRVFAEHRPPGIYKEDYVRELRSPLLGLPPERQQDGTPR